MVSRRPYVFAIAVVFAVIGAGGAGILAQGNSPRTQPVSGLFTASPVNAKQRTCVGQDGLYLEIRGHFSGAITSSDAPGLRISFSAASNQRSTPHSI